MCAPLHVLHHLNPTQELHQRCGGLLQEARLGEESWPRPDTGFWCVFRDGMFLKLANVILLHHVAIPRNDKYSSKVFKYFVEYAETETTKKTNTEKETTTTTGEACYFTFLG